jgi:biopolymer transport protein ExbD
MPEKSNVIPEINITPLIDVLLVLLIIFMVISPLKPSAFKAQVPAEPKEQRTGTPNPDTLVVKVKPDLTLEVNNQKDLGTTDATDNLVVKLSQTFAERAENGAFKPKTNEVERTVFIKAPPTLRYGEIAKVVDAVKVAGAAPIALQIDRLE